MTQQIQGGRKHGLRPVFESVFPEIAQMLAPDPEGCAEGAPNVPNKGVFRKRGPAPSCPIQGDYRQG